jgi:hypothetical protein
MNDATQRFQASVAARRRELEPYQLGWRQFDRGRSGAWVDVTEAHVAMIEAEIAELERVIAIGEARAL